MTVSKFFATLSLVLLVLLTIHQHSGASVDGQEATGKGMLLGYSFVACGLITWIAAMIKAFNANQRGWLVAIIFLWPAMYPYIYKYAPPETH